MNKSILVNTLLNKAGLGYVSVDSIIAPVAGKAAKLRKLHMACYAESDAIDKQIVSLQERQKALLNEGQRAGRIASQLEDLVL